MKINDEAKLFFICAVMWKSNADIWFQWELKPDKKELTFNRCLLVLVINLSFRNCKCMIINFGKNFLKKKKNAVLSVEIIRPSLRKIGQVVLLNTCSFQSFTVSIFIYSEFVSHKTFAVLKVNHNYCLNNVFMYFFCKLSNFLNSNIKNNINKLSGFW